MHLTNLIAILLKITILIFQLFNESDDGVRKFMSCLNVNKVPGMDQIAANFQKETVFVLAYPLPKIIHLLVKLSIFSECKFAKLKPLFKKGCKSDPKNYQPIQFCL